MRKWIVTALVIAAALWFHPFPAADTGELLVAKTLLIEEQEGEISLWAAGLHARGETVQAAVEEMKNNAPGTLFLRQTMRIIFCGGAEQSENALNLPQEIPIGAVVYQSEESAKDMNERLEDLEEQLEARERREQQLPTLAQLQNRILSEDTGKEG